MGGAVEHLNIVITAAPFKPAGTERRVSASLSAAMGGREWASHLRGRNADKSNSCEY